MFSTNELEEMEKEMDDFCSDTNDSEDDKKESRMNDFSEYEPTFEEENENDLDEEQEKRLRNLVLGTNKKGEYDSSDEDSLGGDDIPKGWKQKKKKCPF
ncbi:unnamed protein product [Didymodactylos carnosus]|nr:unnamed protein product [Didymodactylos carnosus]CAF4003457.1 unnamed protein product [Didymodactylos carnosus]